MAHKLRGETVAAKPTEYELVRDKKSGNITLRAFHPVSGKKFRVLSIKNGQPGDSGIIQIHPRNSGLGLQVDRAGYPVTQQLRV